MRQYSCGWNNSNHKVTVMAVSEAQAKFKCKQAHGFYPDYAEQVEFSGYYVKAGALVLADAARHELQLGPHEMTPEGQDIDKHQATANDLGVSRAVAKTVNFGGLYGTQTNRA